MAGICSVHRDYDPDCKMCNTDVRDILPDWDRKHAEAIAAGSTNCLKCGFKYYKTTYTCPKCSHQRMD